MHQAACESDSFRLERALKYKGNPNLVNTNKINARRGNVLWVAISAGRLENVEILLDAGADINAYVHNQYTPLAYSLSMPDFAIALLLLKRGADYLKPASRFETTIQGVQSRIRLVRSGSHSDLERKQITQIVDFLKADGFDPEKAIWDESKLTWKQP